MYHSSALKFNAVADWWDEYIAYVVARSSTRRSRSHGTRTTHSSYDVLKRHIYQLEKEHHRLSQAHVDLEANERTALVALPDLSSIDGAFIPLLDQELHKISQFYEEKEKELFDALQTLEDLVAEQDAVGLQVWEHYMDDDYADEEDDEDDEDEQINDHVHFEDEHLPKRRRRKSSSVSFRPRSGSGESLTLHSTHPRLMSCKVRAIPPLVVGVFPPPTTVMMLKRIRPHLDHVLTVPASRRWDVLPVDS